jgi:BirA family biotin operon repressor/biotin-[acetyl-CoA-carboxylase] ligase
LGQGGDLILLDPKNWIQLNEVSSTNDYLKENRVISSVVTSKIQTRGRGRKNHLWNSESCENLYFSGLVELDSIPSLPLVSLFCGSAVLKTCIQQSQEKSLSLKWPNDIYKENKKIAGLLLEMEIYNEKVHLIVGVGVNFFFEKIPSDLPSAGTLFLKPLSELEKKIFVLQLIENLNKNFLILTDKNLSQNEISWIEKNSYLKDKKIYFKTDEKYMLGEFLGYDENGFLKLKTQDSIQVLMDTDPYFRIEDE